MHSAHETTKKLVTVVVVVGAPTATKPTLPAAPHNPHHSISYRVAGGPDPPLDHRLAPGGLARSELAPLEVQT
eukprot:4526451-Pyramimonas_sp.AAC.2